VSEPPLPGSDDVGQFRLPWSGTQFRNLAPFAIADPSIYVSDGPPSLDSVDYAAAFNEVKLVGSVAIADPAKDATYTFWALGSKTAQPPGAWVQVAQTVSGDRELSLADTARLFALQTMAMADTVAPTFTTKYVYHSWRPTWAIQDAEKDPNPNTVDDDAWSARAKTIGSSPEHWSGHSSFSAAAASVLAGFFCDDGIPFTLTTDLQPETRSYDSFSEAAAEAGRSRVVGGIHFEFSNQAGLAAGRAVAAEVLDKSLLLTRGETHHGSCPL
jgi:hypothetical protein